MRILSGPALVAYMTGLALTRHAGTDDQGGAPMTGHVQRVRDRAETIRQLYAPELDPYLVAAVAIGHDLIEETSTTLDELAANGVPDEGIDALRLLTHAKHQPRVDYIAGIATSILAAVVKLADTLDNLDPARLSLLDPATRTRLIDKYTAAKTVLREVLEAHRIYMTRRARRARVPRVPAPPPG